MGDETAAASTTPRAKSKSSKWGKILHKDKSAGGTGNFKLNEDVADFLKPSTDKYSADSTQPWSSAPRVDVSLRQKWPEPGEIKRAMTNEANNNNNNNTNWVAPRKGKKLTVTFVKTVPEIIGEGGDEAEAPVMEVSRSKAKNQRSFSDRRPPSSGLMDVVAAAQRQTANAASRPPLSSPPRNPYSKPDIHRSKTSAGETSYHVQQKPIEPQPRPLEELMMRRSPPQEEVARESEPRPGMLRRAPTTFNEEEQPMTPTDTVPQLPNIFQFQDFSTPPPGRSSYHQRDPSSPMPPEVPGSRLFVRKAQHRMNAEGRTFRRVSRQEFTIEQLAELNELAHVDSPTINEGEFVPTAPTPAQETVPETPLKNNEQRQPTPVEQVPSRTGSVERKPVPPEHHYLAENTPIISFSSEDDRGDFMRFKGMSPIVEQQQQRQQYPHEYQQQQQQQQQQQYQQYQHEPYQQQYHQEQQQQQHQPQHLQSLVPQKSQSRTPTPERNKPRSQHTDVPRINTTYDSRNHGSELMFSPPPDQDKYNFSPPDQKGRNMFSPADERIMWSPTEDRNRNMASHSDERDRSFFSPQDERSRHVYPPQDERKPPIPAHDNRSYPPPDDRNRSMFSPPDDRSRHVFPPQEERKQSIPVPEYRPLPTPSPDNSNALKLPGQANFSRSGGSFQGITPTPNHGPTTSYFAAHPNQTLAPQGASPAPSQELNQPGTRPSSQNSHYKPFAPMEAKGESLEYVAFQDFDARVAHMRGVFRLTAEREQPFSAVTPRAWLRAATWWLHKGRAGLGQVARNMARGPDGQKRELLTQAHVDVAKTWWILNDMLENIGSPIVGTPTSQDNLKRDVDIMRSHLRSLALSMQRNDVMPPHHSLIQGQDTTIWVQYPRFAPDAASMLRGGKALRLEDDQYETDPLEALPAGDSRSAFFYNRMFVDVSMSTDEAETDRVVLPCILTMMRSKSDFQPTIVISSQTDLVNVFVRPGSGGAGKSPTWKDVSWKGRSHGIYIALPRGFNLNVEFQETDFRTLWNMVEYTRKTEANLQPQADETLVHQARLTEVQYSDSSNLHSFPKDRVRACTALVFERIDSVTEGHITRKMHRGFRFLLITNTTNKTLSSVTHEIGRGNPFLFENAGNPAAGEVPALVIRIQEVKRSCKILLLFGRGDERQHLYDVLNGIVLRPHEAFTSKAPLKHFSVEPAAANTPGSALPGNGALDSLRWQGMRVINIPMDNGADPGVTVLSETLRIVGLHDSGCITDRMNLVPGELLFRLPLQLPTTIQLLRGPQADLSLSVETRRSPPQLAQALSELMHTIATKPTIRTLTFASTSDLHAFQTSISRFTVRLDMQASLFAISRRRMVVNISKKLETSKCRVQILTQSLVTQMAVFFEGWSVADALVLQLRGSDVFEKVKIKDKEGNKYGVKMVEAKFTLPKKEKEKEKGHSHGNHGSHHEDAGGGGGADEDEAAAGGAGLGSGVKRRFANLEGIEYAEEHDDVTIGFDSEEDRDRFCEQLPAATTTKKFDLRRKI